MMIETRKITTVYARKSKTGKSHEYYRVKFILVLKCDNCGHIFERDQSKIVPRRRSNSYFHVCEQCDSKRFAQRKGVERRKIWDKLASSTDDISKI